MGVDAAEGASSLVKLFLCCLSHGEVDHKVRDQSVWDGWGQTRASLIPLFPL